MNLNEQLFRSAQSGETSRCLKLIASNANINAVDSDGLTPLMYSIAYNKPDTIMVLLEAKADVTMKDTYGWTCLNHAAEQGQLALCRTLVEQHNADVNATSKHGWTALIAAASWGHTEVCVYLLNVDARVDAETKQGETALQLAVRKNRLAAVAVIRAWIKDRDAAKAFAQGTKHAYDTYQSDSWTMNHLFDKHLIDEITTYVTPTVTHVTAP